MKKLRFSITVLLFAFLLSCNNTENNKMIVGQWSGVEWVVQGNPAGHDARNTHFSFDDKGNYSFEYSGTKQTGTYKVENDMLFTKPANENEIMVKINKLTKDTLIFDMNRGGQAEILTLIKE